MLAIMDGEDERIIQSIPLSACLDAEWGGGSNARMRDHSAAWFTDAEGVRGNRIVAGWKRTLRICSVSACCPGGRCE